MPELVREGFAAGCYRNDGIAPTNNYESALRADLSSGNYTAVMSGTNGATGIGLIEAYSLP